MRVYVGGVDVAVQSAGSLWLLRTLFWSILLLSVLLNQAQRLVLAYSNCLVTTHVCYVLFTLGEII